MNNAQTVKQVTRQRVLEAARALNYVPAAAGKTLSSGKTQTLGLMICQADHLLTDAFIPQVIYGMNEVSREHGYKVLVEPVEDVARPDAYTSLVHAKQIDGLIVLNLRSHDPQLLRLIDEEFPVVLIGELEHPKAYCVTTEGAEAAERAVTHLVGLGHRRIAYISYAPEGYFGALNRLEGYQQALRAANIPFDPSLVRYGAYSAESGYEAMRSLLSTTPDLTAVFAGNDTIAFGAMTALHQRGLRIPEEVAVVGFDDLPMAAFATPPLTTVRTHAVEQARHAGTMLVELMAGKAVAKRRVEVATELVVRRSCGASRLGTIP